MAEEYSDPMAETQAITVSTVLSHSYLSGALLHKIGKRAAKHSIIWLWPIWHCPCSLGAMLGRRCLGWLH